jgi:hypothetical protein
MATPDSPSHSAADAHAEASNESASARLARTLAQETHRLLAAYMELKSSAQQQKSRFEEHILQVTAERDEARKAEALARDFAAETQVMLDEAEREIAQLLQARSAAALDGAEAIRNHQQEGSNPHNIHPDPETTTLTPEAIEALVQEIDACIALLQR